MRLFLIPILLLLATNALSQENEFGFVSYLIDQESYDEASFVLENILMEATSGSGYDSANYFLGRLNFEQKLLARSVTYYDKVSTNIPSLSTESVFYKSLARAHIGKLQTASNDLRLLTTEDPKINALKNLELSAIQLLQNNYANYDSLSKFRDTENYLYATQFENLDFHKNKLIKTAHKKPWVAGMMSAVIPGSGRFYVGKPGQGIYQFIIASILGLQTIEGYRKDGPESARFIIYASLFTSFYISNVWGSVIGVKLYKNTVNETVKNAILVDMHIPIRSIFR